MLTKVTTVSRHKSIAALVRSNLFNHCSNGVHHIVISSTAMERQPTSDRQRSWIINRQTKRISRHRHRTGEAGIEIDVFYIINAEVPIRAGIFKYLLCHHPHGFARVIILPAKNTFLFGIRTSMQKDELVIRYSEFPGVVNRGKKQRGRLVNLVHGVHILGIRPGHVTITVCCRRNLFRATLDRIPSMRALSSDLGKPGKQLTQP